MLLKAIYNLSQKSVCLTCSKNPLPLNSEPGLEAVKGKKGTAPAAFFPAVFYSAGAWASFPKCPHDLHILLSSFFSFEVFDVFGTTGKSFSMDFCCLIFLILTDTLTRVLN